MGFALITLPSSLFLDLEEVKLELHINGSSKKSDVPLIGPANHYQLVCHESILDTSYVIQNWKSFLEGRLPTPHIIPKTDPGPISQDKSGIATKQAPPLPNVLPNPHSVRPRGV
jgi:hypothetical protein